MKALIIINGYQIASGVTNQVSRLKEELLNVNVSVDIKRNTELSVFINKDKIDCTLPKYDFVIYLDKDRYTARMLEAIGYKVFNSADALELCDDKMLTHIALAKAGIRMPLTISSPLCFHDDGNREYINEVEKKLTYPLIVKENYGSLGKQVYLINNRKELEEISERLLHTNHLYQEFISSSKGKDYRIIVIGHKVVAYMKRENKNSYLSNLASGGSSSVVELAQSYLDMAIKASEVLGLDYCGVDLLEGPSKEPILSEVNSNAFFEGIEKTTKINVAKAYVDYMVKEINSQK